LDNFIEVLLELLDDYFIGILLEHNGIIDIC